jgi:hypothetical protein
MKEETQLHLKKYLQELKNLAKLFKFSKLLMSMATNPFKKQQSMEIRMP